MAEETVDIEQKIKEKLEKDGKISAADLADFSTPEVEETRKSKFDEATEVDNKGSGDPLVKQAGGRSAGSALIPGRSPRALLEISPEDKKTFIQAVVSNERFKLSFKPLNGAVSLTIRSRTVQETEALISQLYKVLNGKETATAAEYQTQLRVFMMVFQVEELNGVKFMPPSAPLVTTKDDNGVQEPGWLGRIAEWSQLSDALHTIIWDCIQEFEDKYWTMTESAGDSNFWQPEASI